MKKIKFYTVLLLSIFFVAACDTNDTLNDTVIVGKMAPHVYWEVGSSTLSAGNNVPFIVQYYTTGQVDIDRLEVWYNLVEEESKTVSSPWTQTFNYSFVSTKTTIKRIPQKVSEYVHNGSYWSDSLHAFSFAATFPTSNTLAAVSWIKPATFDAAKMTGYFGENFMQQFKDSLFKLMKATDFQKMYLGLSLVDNFKVYLDSTRNENTGGWDYHFPRDAQGNTPVPQPIINIYQTIPFSDLILNKSTNNYEVEYSRSYKINAGIRAVDKEGTVGLSVNQDISLN